MRALGDIRFSTIPGTSRVGRVPRIVVEGAGIRLPKIDRAWTFVVEREGGRSKCAAVVRGIIVVCAPVSNIADSSASSPGDGHRHFLLVEHSWH